MLAAKMLTLLILLTITSIVSPFPLVRRTLYNETEARIFLQLAAGAYAEKPDECLNRTFHRDDAWMVAEGASYLECDAFESLCASYVIHSHSRREIVVVFRGTKTKEQLIIEGWQSLQPGYDFYGMGMVHKYFFRALTSLWHIVEPSLRDPVMADFTVTFTGHSLGGALASLAAARTVLDGFRTGDRVKVYTFGQPRTGSAQFGANYDRMIKNSYRIVHRMDIVPHLPACHKNPHDPAYQQQKSKPCNPLDPISPYHHGTEIWYPNGMGKDAEYVECLGEPKDEDMDCSDALTFEFGHWDIYVNDHRHYFDVQVPNFGKFGCDLSKIPIEPNHSHQLEANREANGQSPGGGWKTKVKAVARILGLSS